MRRVSSLYPTERNGLAACVGISGSSQGTSRRRRHAPDSEHAAARNPNPVHHAFVD